MSSSPCIHVIGLLGVALLLCGMFLPLTSTILFGFPQQHVFSFWVLFASLVAALRYDWSAIISVAIFFLLIPLPLLLGILISLAGLFGKEKRIFFVFHLIFVTLGLIEFLLFFYMDGFAWVGFWLILGGLFLSLGVSIAHNLKEDLSLLPSFPLSRWTHVLGLLGVALLFGGLFLPWLITNFADLSQTEQTSLWLLFTGNLSFFMNSIRYNWPLIIAFSFYFLLLLLPCLTGTLTSLTGLYRQGRRAFATLHLIAVSIGLYSFIYISYIDYCVFYCGSTGPWALKGTKTFGPGFWLILSGFLLSLGIGAAQCRLFTLRTTERDRATSVREAANQ